MEWIPLNPLLLVEEVLAIGSRPHIKWKKLLCEDRCWVGVLAGFVPFLGCHAHRFEPP